NNSNYIYTSYNTAPHYAQELTASSRTLNMITWTQTRILGTSDFLYTSNFYDDKGRVIQVKSTNITGGVDVTTTQYSWAGQPLVVIQKQQKAGTGAESFEQVTKYSYDDLGRVVKTDQKRKHTAVNANSFSDYKTISELSYDALGQVKQKTLSPDYDGGSGLEKLDYDYNIRGWTLGVNRQYISNSHERYFGFELAYDKAPNIIGGSNNYTGLQYNGNIAGTTWKSAGDEERRRYLFTYDAANRLKTANFTQYTGSSFNQTAGLDFTVNNLQYDANGNITRMNQYGWKGGAGSVMIDELRYNHLPTSNKLRNVYDFQQDPHSKLGDFKYSVNYIQNKSHNLTQDYWFDANGNMVTDRNKEIGNSVQPG